MADIKPLADRVVVRDLTEEESGKKSASGIIIPNSIDTKEKSDQGIVVAVGPGKWDEDGEKRIPMEVAVGDKVLFSSWREKVKVGDEEFSIVSESDVLGVIS